MNAACEAELCFTISEFIPCTVVVFTVSGQSVYVGCEEDLLLLFQDLLWLLI